MAVRDDETYDVCSGAALVDHAQEVGYQLAKIEGGHGDTAAAVTEIDTLMGKLTVLRERLTGQAAPVDEHRLPDVTPQTLPGDLVAHVEQTWQDLHERLPDDLANTEYWATRAARHDQMAAAYGQLLDALTDGGLLLTLALDARNQQTWPGRRSTAQPP